MTKTTSWTPPPLRAAFIIDDPNLHWPSYGYVDFLDLARHAHAHRYHASMAIIPLDLWYFDRRAVRIFRESAAELSLVVHGNDHVRAELAQPRPEREALGLVAQALCRVSRFERRTGLQIDRVMVPPHGDCNDTMFDALARAGFDALSWSPKPSSAISGWEVADVAPGGLPSIPRTLLGDRDDLPFRAYLDQPIVLEGHHTDLADGLDLLQEAAGDVNGLGERHVELPRGNRPNELRVAAPGQPAPDTHVLATRRADHPRRSRADRRYSACVPTAARRDGDRALARRGASHFCGSVRRSRGLPGQNRDTTGPFAERSASRRASDQPNRGRISAAR